MTCKENTGSMVTASFERWQPKTKERVQNEECSRAKLMLNLL